jgi:hypothetical protein
VFALGGGVTVSAPEGVVNFRPTARCSKSKAWIFVGVREKAIVSAHSSPTLGATGEPAQTITGMGIAEVKQRGCPDLVWVAGFVNMHGPISPKKIEIARYQRNSLQIEQPRLKRALKQKLSSRIIKNDFVEDFEKIRRFDRTAIRCHDEVTSAPLGWNDYRHKRGGDIGVIVKIKDVFQTGFALQAAKDLTKAVIGSVPDDPSSARRLGETSSGRRMRRTAFPAEFR